LLIILHCYSDEAAVPLFGIHLREYRSKDGQVMVRTQVSLTEKLMVMAPKFFVANRLTEGFGPWTSDRAKRHP
jgi:hypothetical protein